MPDKIDTQRNIEIPKLKNDTILSRVVFFKLYFKLFDDPCIFINVCIKLINNK